MIPSYKKNNLTFLKDIDMENQFAREELILGKSAVEKLQNSRVAVFGVGGVGGYTIEALARAGVGALDLIDADVVTLSNLNRQIIATYKTLGKAKVDVAAERIADINPKCKINTRKIFFLPENSADFDFSQYDYVVDAIDTVSGKIGLVLAAKEANVPIICAMGAGNKLNPTAFEVADIYSTSVCPLAHVMRKELRKKGIKHLKVVYSKEPPIKSTDSSACGRVPGSVSFVPPVAGLIMAGEVIKDLINTDNEE